jgi:hypothetical protein
MKKEPCWDLSINTEAGDGPKSTPRKRAPKGTPKKNVKAEMVGSDEDDDEETFTPSKKKAALNKVQSGRVAKPSRAKSVRSYAEEDDGEDDMAVKGEVDDMTFETQSNEQSANDNG